MSTLFNRLGSVIRRLMQRLWPRHLWRQLALIVACILATVFGGYVIYSVQYISSVLEQAAQKELSALGRNIALDSTSPLLLEDYTAIEALMLRMAEYPSVQRIEILRADGRSIGRVLRNASGRVAVDFSKTPITKKDAETQTLAYPIGIDPPIGTVYIDYSLKTLQDLRQQIRKDTFIGAGLAIVAAMLLLGLFFRRPARGLERATQFARALDTDAGKTQKVTRSNLELEQLGDALNRTSRRLAEQQQALKMSAERIQAILEHAADAIITTDEKGVIESFNRAAEHIFLYTHGDIIGKRLQTLLPRLLDGNPLAEHLNTTGLTRTGTEFPAELSVSEFNLLEQRKFIVIVRDITERQQAESKIYQLAFYDPLTHLPNRRLLQDRLRQAIAHTARDKQHGAVLFIDLDDFKMLNDTQGHNTGDLLLIEIAKRLQDGMRSGDTIARLSGDEFVAILSNLSEDPQHAFAATQDVATKLLKSINQPFNLLGVEYYGSASIGIRLFRDHDISMDDLLKQADSAMYQAKNAGRNTLYCFDPPMQAALDQRAAMKASLHQALPKQQLRLYYQAQFDEKGNVVAAEALIRWAHPTRGLLLPEEFIALAEDTGLIVPIGHWVLHTACVQLKAWEKSPDTSHLQLSINVSSRQFRQPDFATQVLALVKETGINPMKLKLELTERLVLENIPHNITKIQDLRAAGISFSLDDFGTGYSSLSYLRRLPLDQIKIDQSFVQDITTDAGNATIVRTIIGMAQNLGLEIVAEGVETQQQFDFLKDNGCYRYQGFLFDMPRPIEEFSWLALRESYTNA